MSAGTNLREAAKGGRFVDGNGEEWQAWYNGTGAAIASGTPVYALHTGTTDPDQMTAAEIADDGTTPDLWPYAIVDHMATTTPGSTTPKASVANATYGWVKTKGDIRQTTLLAVNPTAGHAVKVHNRAVTTTGAVPSQTATNEPGMFLDGGSSVNHVVHLFGRDRVTTTT